MTTTLVIHPKDPSTDFCCPIYADLDATVVRENKTDAELRDLIDAHERVILVGHGSPGGLADMCDAVQEVSPLNPFIITREHAKLLRQKADNSMYVWCNADQFVQMERLHGFYSGMFISEVDEAAEEGVDATQSEVDISNTTFVECLRACATKTATEMRDELMGGTYAELAKTNAVAAFNLQRLYCA